MMIVNRVNFFILFVIFSVLFAFLTSSIAKLCQIQMEYGKPVGDIAIDR